MERMTRMSKYKELRESLKKDVVTTEETYVTEKEVVKDANYYRNLVGEKAEEQIEIKTPIKDDTLYESLTFETITENETEEVKTALDKVRENNGQEQYNTRMDILNKIRQSKVEKKVEKTEEVIDEIEEEIEEEHTEETENRFGYVKETKVEEVSEEEEIEQEEPKKKFGLFKKKNVDEEDEEEIEEDDEEEEEDEEEGSSFMVKLLNGCIIILVLVLIGLVGFIAKEVLF